jgi:GntP family gluconate:H+ symporter
MVTVIGLVFVMGLILLATTIAKVHPFLTLLLAAVFMGFWGGLDMQSIVETIADGFGGTLKSIGIVIACGTIIGTFLERSGGARAMAASVLKAVGEKKSPLAMSITGFVVSIPVFCDSGFVILAALNNALSRRTGISLTVLAVALATGLYTTHVFVPPTPGPLAAAATIGADIGLVIIFGLIVSIPAAGAGLLWARIVASRFTIVPDMESEAAWDPDVSPSATLSFAPLIFPIILIALKSIADYPTAPLGAGTARELISFIGHPILALLFGVFLAFGLKRRNSRGTLFDWVASGLMNAGVIILITGAGGAFGSVLRATDIGNSVGKALSQWQIGIFLPFVLAAVLKTAQGSSTVSIITTAALISPLLEPLGFVSPVGRALVVLAIGAGSMTVSHVNDSYFWVVSQFSSMNTATALRCHTAATFVQGITGIAVIAVMSWLLV